MDQVIDAEFQLKVPGPVVHTGYSQPNLFWMKVGWGRDINISKNFIFCSTKKKKKKKSLAEELSQI